MTRALSAEWSKLRSLPGTVWMLLGLAVLTAGLSSLVVALVHASPGGGAQDPTALSLSGVDLGQAIAAAFGVLVVSSEYGTGMIRLSFTAIPRRVDVLAAKAATVGWLVLAAAVLGVAVSLLTGLAVLPGHGFTAGHAAVMSLSSGSTLRAAVGSVLYLGLVALFGLGIAAAVRDTAAALGVALGLLYLFPLMSQVVTDHTWHRILQQIAPMSAGLAVQATVNLRSLPISPWAGLGVLAAWAVGALVIGAVVTELRDA